MSVEICCYYIKIMGEKFAWFFNGISFIKKKLKPYINYNETHLHDVLQDQLYSIDEITAEDLQLKDFCLAFDKTITSCGTELFHHWLYSVKSRKDVLLIQKDIKKLSHSNLSALEKLLHKRAGKQKKGNFVRDLWNDFSINNWVINHFYLLYFLNIISFALFSIFFTKFIAVFVILFFLVNFVFYLLTNVCISHIASSIGYFLSLCITLSKIQKKYHLELTLKIPEYKKFSHLFFQTIFFKEGLGGPSSGDILSVFLDYLRVFFALELLAFKRTEKIIKRNIKDVREIFLYVGYIDCLLNICRIMENNACCLPCIEDDISISFKNMKHPLVKDCVSQTRTVEKNLIVTGLNMSGKTTFMKSLGLNQILASSFGFCFAEKFTTSTLNVLSSICINDELLNGKSRYYAEAERLVEIKKIIESNSCLCLVDEILSGTNSEERIYGSTLILKEFARNKSIFIAATHDTQIAVNLTGIYEPVYFDGEICNDVIKFDYTIKEGIVSKKNGLLLLKLLGIQ